ncbi:MAG: flagellar hook-associated protein FlgK [Chloroflexi bacterium]|nr:flagellar hook-associated protein FlgK [Chloroflexota bacterium]
MPSTFSGINIALRAVLTNQRAIDVISHNVANVNTPGYTRQEAVLVTSEPWTEPGLVHGSNPGQVGTGVQISQIRRYATSFFDQRIRGESQTLGRWQITRGALEQISVMFTEPSETGVAAALDQFWSAWQDLASNPESLAARETVIQDSKNLTTLFHTFHSQLANQQKDIDHQLSSYVQKVNESASELARLNTIIAKVESIGDHPNDLLDRRDMILDRLAEIVDIQYAIGENDATTVAIGGHSLVMGSQSVKLQVGPDPANNNLSKLTWADDGSQASISDGEMAGVIHVRDSVIPDLQSKLDTLAQSLISAVNTVHNAGYALDGTTTGLDFLQGTGANDIAVAFDDPALIGAAGNASSIGDGNQALAISALHEQTIVGGQATAADSFRTLITSLGLDTQHAQTMVQNRSLLVDHLKQNKESQSGVSLDEEAVNLIRFQRGFQAAARAMNVVDEMLNQIVNTLGVVGR